MEEDRDLVDGADEDEEEAFVAEEEVNASGLDPEALSPEDPVIEDGIEGDGVGGEGGEGETEDNLIEFPDDSVQGFFDHKDSSYGVAVNPVRPELVVCGGGDDKGFIWNLLNGERVAELLGHTDSVSGVGWNFDGTLCATAGLDNVIRVWNIEGKLVQTLEGPTGGLNWLRWHPRGNAVLAGSEDCSAWVWMAPQGTAVAVLLGHAGPVECGALTADGKLVVTGSDDMSVRVWSPKDSACLHVMQGIQFHKAAIVRLAVSEKGAILSGDAEGGLYMSNLEGHIKGPLIGHTDSVECIHFVPRLPLAVTGSTDGWIRVWDLDTMSLRQAHEVGSGLLQMCVSNDYKMLSASADGKIRLWDVRSLELLREWQGPTSTINDLAVSHDWKYFVTAEDSGPCLVFSME